MRAHKVKKEPWTMKCVQCGKPIDVEDWGHTCILVNSDGDFVCSQKCKDDRVREQDYFVQNILSDDTRFALWLGVPVEWIADKS